MAIFGKRRCELLVNLPLLPVHGICREPELENEPGVNQLVYARKMLEEIAFRACHLDIRSCPGRNEQLCSAPPGSLPKVTPMGSSVSPAFVRARRVKHLPKGTSMAAGPSKATTAKAPTADASAGAPPAEPHLRRIDAGLRPQGESNETISDRLGCGPADG